MALLTMATTLQVPVSGGGMLAGIATAAKAHMHMHMHMHMHLLTTLRSALSTL